jgi:hypothetical protein
MPNYLKCNKMADHHNPFQPILRTCDKSVGCDISAAPRCFLLSTLSRSCIQQLCNMLGQRQRTVINLIISRFFCFVFVFVFFFFFFLFCFFFFFGGGGGLVFVVFFFFFLVFFILRYKSHNGKLNHARKQSC